MIKYSKLCMVAFIAVGLSASLSAMESLEQASKNEQEEESISWIEQIQKDCFGVDQDHTREELNNNVDEDLERRMNEEEEARKEEECEEREIWESASHDGLDDV